MIISFIYNFYGNFFQAGIYAGKKTAVVQSGGDLFLQVLKQHPEILQQILSTVLNVIMFEDCRNQWSMSRPLLGLILLNEEVSIYTIHILKILYFNYFQLIISFIFLVFQSVKRKYN